MVLGLLLSAAWACAPARSGSSVPSSPSEADLRPTGSTQTAQVVRVVDGDTIIVRLGGRDVRVRYIGIDAPESVRPSFPVDAYGPEAAAENRTLVDGRLLVLERDVSEMDRFGRLLRYAWIQDGDRWTLVNLELVARGYASVLTIPPDVRLADVLLVAERDARAAGRGLWADGGASPSR